MKILYSFIFVSLLLGQNLKFIVVGDWGTGDENQKRVAEQLKHYSKKFQPEFFISVGDNFYDDGVKDIHDVQWTEKFETMYQGLTNIPWYVVLGNHDYRLNSVAQIEYHKQNKNWIMPNRNYVIQKGQYKFLFIDTNPLNDEYYTEKKYQTLKVVDTLKQRIWLDSVLQSTLKCETIIAIGHHPVYSSGEKHGNEVSMIKKLLPRFKKYGVKVYFAGHEHDLQHNSEDNIHYIISGAAAKLRKGSKDMSRSLFRGEEFGFVAVEIIEGKMFVDFINDTGKLLYRTCILLNR